MYSLKGKHLQFPNCHTIIMSNLSTYTVTLCSTLVNCLWKLTLFCHSSLLNNEDRYNFKLSVLLGSAIFGVHLSWFVSQCVPKTYI